MAPTPAPARPVLFVVDDDPAVVQLMGRILAPLADVRFATNGADAIRLIAEAQPDLVLLDAQLGDMPGLQVMAQIRANPLLAGIPILFVTAHQEEDLEVAVLEQGAADFITKPVRAAPLLARVRTQLKVRELTVELRRVATQDALTGVPNRRAFDEHLARASRAANRSGTPLSLLMIDVDCFKAYNDHYGHQAGDDCLRQLGHVLLHLSQRPNDMPARYGGEEFAMILPHTDLAGAVHMGNTLVTAVNQLDMAHAASPVGPRLTVSVGAACLTVVAQPESSAEQLVQLADQALYSAKHLGRNRVCTPGQAP